MNKPLDYLTVINQLLNNEKNVLQHKLIPHCDWKWLASKMCRTTSFNLALKKLDWLLSLKDSFKALEAEYLIKDTMKTDFGECFFVRHVLFRL